MSLSDSSSDPLSSTLPCSTMSTGLNSMSGVIYEDMIKPCLRNSLSEVAASRTMKATVVAIGIVCMALVFLVEKLGGLIQVKLLLRILECLYTSSSLTHEFSTFQSPRVGWQEPIGYYGGTVARNVYSRHVLPLRQFRGKCFLVSFGNPLRYYRLSCFHALSLFVARLLSDCFEIASIRNRERWSAAW